MDDPTPEDLALAKQILWMYATMLLDLSKSDEYVRKLLRGKGLSTPIEKQVSGALKKRITIEYLYPDR